MGQNVRGSHNEKGGDVGFTDWGEVQRLRTWSRKEDSQKESTAI